MQTDIPDEFAIPQKGVPCAFCDSTDTELFSIFGQLLLGSQYYCNQCRTIFEAVRWRETGIEERDKET